MLNEAIDEYWAAIGLDKSHLLAYTGLGICYSILGQFDNAADKFMEAYRLDPRNLRTRRLMAHHYMTRLHIRNAIRAILGLM
jgi:Tfp pilus assembly protein PilF